MDKQGPDSGTSSYALRSCTSCRTRKAKCDRLVPACSMCTRKAFKCEYSEVNKVQRRRAGLSKSAPQNSPSSGSSYQTHEHRRPKFPAIFFLDANTFKLLGLGTSLPSIAIPNYVATILGDRFSIRETSSQYFNIIHEGIPIISKKRFHAQQLNPLSEPRADVALLALCMKLILWAPSTIEESPETTLYSAAKSFHSELQAAGVSSIQVLQAGIIIAYYELGHSIYPAAYMTIGACARYGSAFGFDGKGTSMTSSHDWIDIEERKRAWWTLMILDRLVTLGDPKRTMAIQDPDMNSILPIDNTAWNEGSQPLGWQYTLASPSSLDMGRFARLVQAAYLLGRVLRNAADGSLDATFHKQEASQLSRTLLALVNLSDVEGTIEELSYCPQLGICYCALFILYQYHGGLVTEFALPKGQNIDPRRAFARPAIRICNALLEGSIDSLETFSPLLAPYLYQSALFHIQIQKKFDDTDSIEAWEILKEGILLLNKRWRSAGVYVEILEALEFIPSV
ncbi:hypothetical protein F5884DRAFT_897708 [Xylogone sp. PMI_703]|nr:hypothetical protein F5884DRAFT_897708 [Xylogone sp. PMI_703]